jgi:transposase-like protein
MPKRSCEMFPLSKKVKVLELMRKGKKSYTDIARIYGTNKSMKL